MQHPIRLEWPTPSLIRACCKTYKELEEMRSYGEAGLVVVQDGADPLAQPAQGTHEQRGHVTC